MLIFEGVPLSRSRLLNLALRYLSICCPPQRRIYKVTMAECGDVCVFWTDRRALRGRKLPKGNQSCCRERLLQFLTHVWPNLLLHELTKRIWRLSECECSCSPEVVELWGLCGAKESVSCPSVRIVKEPASSIVFQLVQWRKTFL